CLFAEDAGIFDDGQFSTFLDKYKSNKDPIASDGIDYNKARKDPSIISKVNSDIMNKFKANTKVREANAEAIAKNITKFHENKGHGMGF
ncbi:MAG: hypothetical protein K5656_09235, partial [Lachnospiraceae bacterium]|nr:hypothetical protein [Lachnospiraceae bacterium]